MIARPSPRRRNRRNLAPNPGLLALTIGPVTAAAVATDSVTVSASSSAFGTYVRSNRLADYKDWTNTPAATMIPEQPIAVAVSGTNGVKLTYPTTPLTGDKFNVPSGELAFRTRLGGQIPQQQLILS